jgi:hypothetical protein
MNDDTDKFWDEEAEKARLAHEERTGEKKAKLAQKIPKPQIDGARMRDGLAQLVLTVVELLRELLEKQALRRIEHGALDDEQVERLGNTFSALKDEVEKLKDYFKFDDEDLNLRLGPLLSLRDEGWEGKASAVELLDRLFSKGVVAKGDIVISVAEVDLLSLNLGLLLASIDKAQELYAAPDTSHLKEELRRLTEENQRLRSRHED